MGFRNLLNQKPNLNEFIERNNAILDEFLNVYKQDRQPNFNDIRGTSIPYVFNLLGSWLINPSTVSMSTFQRMSYTDSVITSSLEYNTAIISNTVGDYYHDNKKIQSFVRKAIEEMEEGKAGLIRDMLTAQWAGFYVGEKVYSKPSEFINGKVWIKEVISFPPSSVIFRVNRVGQLDDFVYQYVFFAQNPGIQNSLSYLVPGAGLGGSYEFANESSPGLFPYNYPDGISFAGDADYPFRTTNFQTIGLVPIPRKKVIHYVRRGQDGFLNPYGRSMLRSAYNFYVLKCSFLQFLAIAGNNKSSPLLIAYVDPNAVGTPAQATVGQPDPIQNAPQAIQTALNLVRQALAYMQGDNALVLPGMKGQAFDIQTADIGTNLNLFIDTLKYCDDSMQQSLLVPASMLGGGTGQSYALGTSQSSIQNKLISTMRNSVCQTIRKDFVKDLITMNFEESAYDRNYGFFEAELLNTEDKTNVAKLYEAMKNSGLTTTDIKDDINKYRQIIGDRELTDKEINDIVKAEKEMNAPKTKDSTNKTDVKSTDAHYKKRTNLPKGGSSA